MELEILLTIICLEVLFIIRTVLVHRIRMRQLGLIEERVFALATQGKEWQATFDNWHQGQTSIGQMLDLTKWTHKQFYPRNDSPTKRTKR